jgi:hypothetical protein
VLEAQEGTGMSSHPPQSFEKNKSKLKKGQIPLYKLHPFVYIGVLISLWLFLFPIFLFAAQPKGFFFDGLKKLRGMKS